MTSVSASFRLISPKASLIGGVAVLATLGAAPAFAQASDLRVENERLRQELEALRGELAAARAEQQPRSIPAMIPLADPPQAATPAVAPIAFTANDPPQAGGQDVVVKGRIVGAALRNLKDVPKPVSVVTQSELRIFDQVSLPDALSRLGNVGGTTATCAPAASPCAG